MARLLEVIWKRVSGGSQFSRAIEAVVSTGVLLVAAALLPDDVLNSEHGKLVIAGAVAYYSHLLVPRLGGKQ